MRDHTRTRPTGDLLVVIKCLRTIFFTINQSMAILAVFPQKQRRGLKKNEERQGGAEGEEDEGGGRVRRVKEGEEKKEEEKEEG